jgi:hypothetical protein
MESQLKRELDKEEVGLRLLSIPCVGMLTASTIATEIENCTAVVVTLQRQQGWFPGSTVLVVGRHCWASASEVTKRSEPCWFSVPGYLYKNWNTSLVNLSIE